MDSPPTSSFEFFSQSGELLEGPLEWAPGAVAVSATLEEWEAGARLWRNGGEMELVLRHFAGKQRVTAEWPLSGTGHYELILEVGGTHRAQAVWTIEPRKITPEAYGHMLNDLEESLPVSIAISLRRLGAITGIELVPPGGVTIAEQLVRLRRAVNGTETRLGLASALGEIARDPHRVLATHERWVRRDMARRVHPSSLARVVASGHNLDPSGTPLRLPELRVEPSVDVYENRLIKAYLEEVKSALRRFVAVLRSKGEGDVLDEALELSSRLAMARRQATFLDDVGALNVAANRLTMVLVKRADYRQAFEGFLEFHRRAVVRLEEPALEAPLRGLPSLYESWGTLNVIDVVAGLAAEHGFEVKRHEILGRDGSGFYVRVLPGGPALVLHRKQDNVRVRVTPQKSYRGASKPLHSISYQQIPDIAVEIDRPDHEQTDVYIFDPKYKLRSEEGVPIEESARPKKVDIDTMHAYRDAIRNAEDKHVVRFAATLYPGPTTSFGPGLEAISAVPGNLAAFRTRVRSAIEPTLA